MSQTASVQRSSVASLQNPAKPLVLCVDDSDEILELLSEVLTMSGYRVHCEADPLLACEWIRNLDVDAVVVDYDMPGLNGCDVARAVHREKPDIPVLMFSGGIVPPEALESVTAFLVKNQGVLALIEALDTNVSDGKAESCSLL